MKQVLTLNLGDGIDREIEYITSPSMEKSGKVMIELYDERPLSQVAADFEGSERIVKKDNIREGIETVYTGYTNLIAIQRNEARGSVRITLTKA